MRNNIINKKSQITIFVIIALIIVVAIALVVVLVRQDKIEISARDSPKEYVENCVFEHINNAIRAIQPNGGFLNPASYLKIQEDKATYLCYTPLNKELCSNIHPMLKQEMEKEIYNYIKPGVEDCFVKLRQNLRNSAYDEGELSFSVEIGNEKVSAIIQKKITFSVNSEKKIIEKFNPYINDPSLTFIRIANEAINQEVSCDCGEETCNANIFQIMAMNPGFEVKRFVTGRNEKIYTITEELSGKRFNFAVRNCVRLP
jgi:hypothetical protein